MLCVVTRLDLDYLSISFPYVFSLSLLNSTSSLNILPFAKPFKNV
ncbi:hypothetical protein SCA6_000601 [Theobroma cacao]